MSPEEVFEREKEMNIRNQAEDATLKKTAMDFIVQSAKHKYSYNFSWMGRPIIQFPQDMIAMQELIWLVKPDLIIETGVAHGGSLIYYASLLELIGNEGTVLGIDIEVRKHNSDAIRNHKLFNRIKIIEGSSVDSNIIKEVKKIASNYQCVLVCLDSNHSHEHVLRELELYTPLVSLQSYCVVFDTVIEDMSDRDFDFGTKPWAKGNNAKTAVWKFLESNENFMIDKNIENKLLLTVAPDGFLKRIKQ